MKIIFEDKDKNNIVETTGGNRLTSSDQDKKVYIENPAGMGTNTITLDSDGITLDSPGEITLTAQGNIKIKSKTGKIDIEAMQDVKMKGMNRIGSNLWRFQLRNILKKRVIVF